MNYNNIIDLDNITLEDCERFMENHKRITINDGRIIEIVEEEA